MHLPDADIELFFKLWFSFLSYMSHCYPSILSGKRTTSEIRQLSHHVLLPLRNLVYEHPELIDAFVKKNPEKFTDDELALVREWRHFVRGHFILLQQTDTHAIFLEATTPPKAYAVLALSSSFTEMVVRIPAMIDTTLLPFKGQITYDGIIEMTPTMFSREMRENYKETYHRVKLRNGLITALPFTPVEELK